MTSEPSPPLPGPNGVADGSAAVEDSAASAAPQVAEALAGLAGLEELPVADHVARFDALHEALSAALATIDEV